MTWHGIPVPFTDREDWLAQRREGIGASDVAGILNMSPYATPFTVWADKVHGTEKEVTEAMHFGKVLEDVIVEEFQERTGIYVGLRETLVRHPKYQWVMATIDGAGFESPLAVTISEDGTLDKLEYDHREPLGVVEIKTDSGWGRWDEIPDHYLIQVQWQMLATGLDNAWIVCLHGGKQLEIYEDIKADPGVQNRIVDLAAKFRGNHVAPLEGEPVPPDVDAHRATTRVIKDLWDESTEDKTIELSEEMAADLEALRGWKAQKKKVDAEVKRYENRVKVSLQDAEVGTVDGRVAVTYKTIDRKGFTVEPTSYRSLSVKKIKENE